MDASGGREGGCLREDAWAEHKVVLTLPVDSIGWIYSTERGVLRLGF